MKNSAAFTILLVILLCGVVNLSSAQSTITDTSATKGTDLVFEKTEVEASVNLAAWRGHLEEKLPPYLKKAAKKMKAGTYTVFVRFLVERDGTISDVRALNDPGYGLGEGAVKVVKSGPIWKAGEVNGKKVRSYHTQPIIFMITEQ